MPDPLRDLRPGDRIPTDHTTWNAILAAARAEQRRSRTGAGDLSQFRQADIVRVQNDSGLDLARNSVVGLAGPIFTPTMSVDAFLREVTFSVIVPTADHEGRFAVLMEPALDGRIARAWVAGVCQVKIDVSDSGHTCAEVEAGETNFLVSAENGSAQILWREGDDGYGYDTGEQWAIIRFGTACAGTSTSGGGTYDHCACPETHYVVTTNCGPCPTAPRFWWLDITAATLHSGMMECGGRDCADLAGTQFRMANNDTATDAGCTWETKANGCVTAELTWDAANTRWKLTLADIDDCVMGIWYADEADFDCCGTANSTWTADEANVCDLTFTVSKDDCTCCPPNPITCLPDTGVLCTSFNACCINDESACTLSVTVVGCDDSDALGIPPDVVPDDCKCANLNGGYAMEWVGDCTWVAFTHVADGGGTSHVSRATLTLSGTTWTMTIMGKSGEIAVFRGEWDCGPTINMDYVEDESTCSCIGRLPNFGYGTCTSASFTLGYI